MHASKLFSRLALVLSVLAISSSATILAQYTTCHATGIAVAAGSFTSKQMAANGTMTYYYNFDITGSCTDGYTSQCNACWKTWGTYTMPGSGVNTDSTPTYRMNPGYSSCNQNWAFTANSSYNGLPVGAVATLNFAVVPYVNGLSDCSLYTYSIANGAAVQSVVFTVSS